MSDEPEHRLPFEASEKIPDLSAAEAGQAPQSVCLKDRARENIISMRSTRDTSHFEISTLKDVAPRNMFCMNTTRDTFHVEMSRLKDFASLNILSM